MPFFLRISIVLSACALAACAGTAPRMADAPALDASTQAAQPPRITTDDAYIGRVNREAERRGLTVQWINPPRRRRD